MEFLFTHMATFAYGEFDKGSPCAKELGDELSKTLSEYTLAKHKGASISPKEASKKSRNLTYHNLRSSRSASSGTFLSIAFGPLTTVTCLKPSPYIRSMLEKGVALFGGT
jgi:hypothetical protein